jgi:hypothetical protein
MIKKHALYFSAMLISLSVVFWLVDPESLSSTMLFGVFALLYVCIALCLVTILLIIKGFLAIKWTTGTIRRVGFSLALLPTFLLLLQSVGQLTLRDTLLATGLTILLYLYSHRMFDAPHNGSESTRVR